MLKVFIAALLAASLLLQQIGETIVFARSSYLSGSAFGYTHQISTGLTLEQMGYIDLHSLYGVNPGVVKIAGYQQDFSHRYTAANLIFPYFDQQYSTFEISSNGFIHLGTSEFLTGFNSPVPGEAAPNNLIAPFWDDLYYIQAPVYAGVYLLEGTSNNQHFLAVEWYHPSRYGQGSADYRFEAILWENGNITFNYSEMNGDVDSASVGIEESQGVDGVHIFFNESGLTAGTQIQITRPPDGPSLKVIPAFQSAFLNFHVTTLPITVTNTGTNYFAGYQDVFEINVLNVPSEWDVQFQNALGQPVMQIADRTWETPAIPDGDSINMLVRIRAPEYVLPGEYRQLEIEVTSRNAFNQGVERKMVSTAQVAIPVPFAQAINDSSKGISTRMISPDGYMSQQLSRIYSDGQDVAITTTPTGKHLTSWVDGFTTYPPRLSYAYTTSSHTGFSGVQNTVVLPATCSNWTIYINCQLDSPSVTALPNGYVAILYIAQFTNNNFESQYNLHLLIIDSSNNTEVARVPITNFTQFSLSGNNVSPVILTSHVAATADGHLIIAWEQETNQADQRSTTVFYRVLNHIGVPVGSAAQPIDLSTANRQQFPNLVATAPDQVMLGYIVAEASGINQVVYSIVDTTGTIVQSPRPVPEAFGSEVDMVLQFDNQVVIAWKDQDRRQIAYTILQKAAEWEPKTGVVPTLLSLQSGFESQNPSLTNDTTGNAIVTWEAANSLNYAVIGTDGLLVTPPMIFMKPSEPDGSISSSGNGEGSVPLEGIVIVRGYIPFILR